MTNMKTLIIPVLVGALIFAAVGFTVQWEGKRYKQRVRDDIAARLRTAHGELAASLSGKLSLVEALVAYATDNPMLTEDGFRTFASGLLGNRIGIRSLQLAPDSIVTYVYPLKGNEAALGHNLLADPNRRQAVQQAIDNRQFVIAGPVALRQGGVALIGRKPIFIPADGEATQGDRYWGLAVILADLDPLLAEAGILNAPDGIAYAIRGKDGLGPSGDTFFGNSRVFESDPETLEVPLPNGSWQLAAFPVGGWPSSSPASLWLWGLGGVLALGASSYAWRVTTRSGTSHKA